MANIDLSAVDWRFVGLMTALAFITALLGSYIAYRNRAWGAIIAAILFAIGFLAWNYYPHNFGLPILDKTKVDGTSTSLTVTAPSAVPAAASAPLASAPATPAPAGPPADSSH
jgi:hypothetical protein